MAKIASRPKTPSVTVATPAVVQTVTPVATAATTPTTTTSAASTVDATSTDTQAEARTKVEELAKSRAGRASTVLTSWRGVLSPAFSGVARKNLLGE